MSMMSLMQVNSLRCKLCSQRPMTYSYLSSILQKSKHLTPFDPSRTFSIKAIGYLCQRIHLKRGETYVFHCDTPMYQRRYSTKARVPPEKKQVYRNPKLGYVWTPELARFIRGKIWPGDSLKSEKALVVDSNAGPGLLSKELLDAGVKRLITMDRNKEFLPRYRALQEQSNGRLLQAFHADFYKIQYHGDTPYAPPVIRIKDLFQDISPVSWESDIPIKVLGSFPHRKEKTQAYLFASLMLERLSVYSYGRAQFNFLLSEGCYETITQPPGSYFKYRALSALYQLGFDIKLLHKEPLSSFASPSGMQNSSVNSFDSEILRMRIDFSLFPSEYPSHSENTPAYLYLTQLTPKRDLFMKHNLSQQQAFVFVYFMRQTLSKRSSFLTEVIEKWAPGCSHILSEMGLSKKTRSGDVNGETLMQIFMMICEEETFNGSWMGEDAMTYALKAIPSQL